MCSLRGACLAVCVGARELATPRGMSDGKRRPEGRAEGQQGGERPTTAGCPLSRGSGPARMGVLGMWAVQWAQESRGLSPQELKDRGRQNVGTGVRTQPSSSSEAWSIPSLQKKGSRKEADAELAQVMSCGSGHRTWGQRLRKDWSLE